MSAALSAGSTSGSAIRIRNARSHNLRGIDCDIPLRALTVVSGVSGSGKSSLAFDTLYAEGQRRYVTSLSTYARQFLERLPRPQVDSISHLPPAIAIEQRNRVTNARSTVGTATEVLDYLRLLYARIGDTRCPDCDRLASPGGAVAVAERILARWPGTRLQIATPFPGRRRGESVTDYRDRLAGDGYTRILDGQNRVADWASAETSELDAILSQGLLLIDRLVANPDTGRRRLVEAVSAAFASGEGHLVVVDEDGVRHALRDAFSCDGCGRDFSTPEPSLFSFNSAMGACSACQGFGRVPVLDRERLVPNPELSLEAGAIAPFATPMGQTRQYELVRASERRGVATDRAFETLSQADQDWVIEGDDEAWPGVRGFFEELEKRRYKVQARVLIARYRRYDACPDCRGARLCADALCVEVDGFSLGRVSSWSLGELRRWADAFEPPGDRAEAGERVLERLRARLATVEDVGLGYLGIDRPLRTLSGGEAQRIQLATALSGRLTSVLYVLDEPSVGLHPRDVERLLDVLATIRAQGNTVVVVEHAPEIVSAADHVIELGPAAGQGGGGIVIQGDVETLRAHPTSPTGRALRGEGVLSKPPRRSARGELRVLGATENNLRDFDVSFPLGQLTAVTGVSGAGKSTLVHSVLVGNLQGDPDRGACTGIEGADAITEAVVVDQRPASRSPRSNPATVSKAFEAIRRRFAATREARALGVGPGWFSFNVPGGRCDTCEGAGQLVIDMQFLDDVRVPCDDCGGLRYRKEVLGVRFEGRSIVDVLELGVDEAIEAFATDPAIVAKLAPLARVGLGYLPLGQPLSTLSGGEHQRIRLALALSGESADRLYVLDEPTTGLHPADIRVLLGAIDALVDSGGTVVVVEHNLDVVRHADFVIDLGPEGGPGGGQVLATGSPEEIARDSRSHTGAALRLRRGVTEPG